MRLTLIALSFFVAGCNVPDEPIVLKGIQEVKLGDLNADETRLTATAELHNPNDLKVRIKHLELTVWVDGKASARIDQAMDQVVPPRADFSVPLEAMVSMKELGLLDKIFSILQGKKIAVEYQGSIKVRYRLIPVRVPIRHKTEIKLKM
jgi:LEA14-like dessication related protein